LTTDAVDQAFNIGSGEPRTVLEVASSVIDTLNADVEPKITGKYRCGDIRHCFADISKARELLGFEPHYHLDGSLESFAEWVLTTEAIDRNAEMTRHLKERGLMS
jgi:dTDP-L-rhamnose 4-epimerase